MVIVTGGPLVYSDVSYDFLSLSLFLSLFCEVVCIQRDGFHHGLSAIPFWLMCVEIRLLAFFFFVVLTAGKFSVCEVWWKKRALQ